MFCDDVFIDANPMVLNLDLNTISVLPGVLGEGSFGCVLKSTDNRFAIKIQDVTQQSGSERCVYESKLQSELARAVPKSIVSNVYFYSGNVATIPELWRSALSSACNKAPQWSARGWRGPFCVTVMDFVPGKEPNQIEKTDFPLFCFGLLYTTSEAFETIGFQHIDIKTANIIMTDTNSTSEKFSVCRLSSEFKFDSAKKIPRLLDFGISIAKNKPASIDAFANIGGTLTITPVEVIIGRLFSNTPNFKTYMYAPNSSHYHWSYDLYSIGITILSATVLSNAQIAFPLSPLPSAIQYINSFSQQYLKPGGEMTLLYIYNVCILQHLMGNGAYPSKSESVFYPQNTLGYELLCTPTARSIIDYIIQQDQGVIKPKVDYFRQTYGEEALKLVASLIQWNPEKRGGGRGKVLLHSFFTPYLKKGIQCKSGGKPLKGINPKDPVVIVGQVSKRNRQERLKKYVKTLYHQTSPEAAKAIIASQQFRLGASGYAGGGIYFTDDAETTNYKAHSKGVVIKADVLLGNAKTIYGKDESITFDKLLREGFDSIFLIRPTGAEYVVYNSDQVRNVRKLDEEDILNMELSQTYEANRAAGVMFLIVGKKNNQRVVLLGRELGGAYKGQFNMFGGRHDKSRTRAETARAEWCEEFGASSLGPGTDCAAPEVWILKKAKKIFANNRIEKDGPSKTTIVILWDVGNNVTSRKKWNANNLKARQNPNVPKSYKEMDRLEMFYLKDLNKTAQSTPQGRSASIKPADSSSSSSPVIVSMFTLETIRNMKQKKYI